MREPTGWGLRNQPTATDGEEHRGAPTRMTHVEVAPSRVTLGPPSGFLPVPQTALSIRGTDSHPRLINDPMPGHRPHSTSRAKQPCSSSHLPATDDPPKPILLGHSCDETHADTTAADYCADFTPGLTGSPGCSLRLLTPAPHPSSLRRPVRAPQAPRPWSPAGLKCQHPLEGRWSPLWAVHVHFWVL